MQTGAPRGDLGSQPAALAGSATAGETGGQACKRCCLGVPGWRCTRSACATLEAMEAGPLTEVPGLLGLGPGLGRGGGPQAQTLAPALQGLVEAQGPALGLAQDVADVLEDLLIAVAGLGIAGHRAGGQVALPLLQHQPVLPLLGLRELGRYDNEAQVDHEEGAHL